MDSWFALTLAEEIVDEHGDINWFCEHYTLCREFNTVKDSLEMALREQNLWDRFLEVAAERTGQKQ